MKNKTILFFCTNSLREQIVKSMLLEGYNVIDFHENFEIKNYFYDKYLNILHRKLLNDKNYYTKIRKIRFIRKSNKKINNILKNNNIDYCVFFRADLYDIKLIKKLRKNCPFLSTYQCDGINGVAENIIEYRIYFNSVYSFNPPDVKIYNFKFMTNFYFEKLYNSTNINDSTKKAYYLGMWNSERDKSILNLNSYIKNLHLHAYFNIAKYRNLKNIDNINYSTVLFSYDDNIELLKKSDIIIDLVYSNHQGLSFRFFEAIYFQKKIITNNQDVINYDFYSPNNIYITDFINFEGLKDFIESEYIHIDKSILNKYSFKNWLNNILS